MVTTMASALTREERGVREDGGEVSEEEQEGDAQNDRAHGTGDDDNLPTSGEVIDVAFHRGERTRERLVDFVANQLGVRAQIADGI